MTVKLSDRDLSVVSGQCHNPHPGVRPILTERPSGRVCISREKEKLEAIRNYKYGISVSTLHLLAAGSEYCSMVGLKSRAWSRPANGRTATADDKPTVDLQPVPSSTTHACYLCLSESARV